MGDRAWMQARIPHCPTRRDKVLEILGDYFPEAAEAGELDTTATYEEDEVSLGAAYELAGRLIDAAPRCSFEILHDPFAGEVGDWVAYTPRLGHYQAGWCGDVVLGWTEVDTVLRQWAEPGASTAAVLAVAYGLPWDAELRARRDGTPIPPLTRPEAAVLRVRRRLLDQIRRTP